MSSEIFKKGEKTNLDLLIKNNKSTSSTKEINYLNVFPPQPDKQSIYSIDHWWEKTHRFNKFAIIISVCVFILLIIFSIYTKKFDSLLILIFLVVLIMIVFTMNNLADEADDNWSWVIVVLFIIPILLGSIIVSKHKKPKVNV